MGSIMHELFKSSDAAPMVGISIMAICVALTVIGCTIAVQWRKARQSEVEAALKRDMVERGMPTADIIRVLQAGGDTVAGIRASLLKEMMDQGMNAEDIARILQAYGGSPAGALSSQSAARPGGPGSAIA
jgi:hypothetical protein